MENRPQLRIEPRDVEVISDYQSLESLARHGGEVVVVRNVKGLNEIGEKRLVGILCRDSGTIFVDGMEFVRLGDNQGENCIIGKTYTRNNPAKYAIKDDLEFEERHPVRIADIRTAHYVREIIEEMKGIPSSLMTAQRYAQKKDEEFEGASKQ
jgi:hypothetical protein